MQIPQIQITKTDIQMDQTVRNAKVEMTQSKVEQKIEQPAAEMNIETTQGQLHIDASQARRDIGMISPFESVKNYAQKGREAALQGISRRVSEGRQLLETAGKGQGREPIINIAKQNHAPKRPGPIGIDFVPKYGSVQIDYTPGEINIDIKANQPIIEHTVNKGKYNYTAGSINSRMVQRQAVQIDVVK